LVPEKREEVTTEGGLDCIRQFNSLISAISRLKDSGLEISIFIDPQLAQIEKALSAGAQRIELHTGTFANYYYQQRGNPKGEWLKEKEKLFQAARAAHEMGLAISAGHGLNYLNIKEIKKMPQLNEVNIGHAIIARSVFTGLKEAVREMANLLLLNG
jgi:pyridoxine 5-phosphate synthase